jgi:ribonuclease P/MRP protein subunit RPP1
MASQLHAIPHLSPMSSSSGMAAATSSSSFRRALSTGDLILRDREEEQRVGAAAATRYSAEERRERIDKYRSKRNQRNFQKKITVCLLQHIYPCIYWFGWFQLALAASSNIRK